MRNLYFALKFIKIHLDIFFIGWLSTYLPVLARFRGWTWYLYITLCLGWLIFGGLTFGSEFMLVIGGWLVFEGWLYSGGGFYWGIYGNTVDNEWIFYTLYLHMDYDCGPIYDIFETFPTPYHYGRPCCMVGLVDCLKQVIMWIILWEKDIRMVLVTF